MADDIGYLGQDVPKLGFGLMRLPKRAVINEDIKQVSQMVDLFLGAGMRYFDTAYVYDLGRSEKAIKQALVDRYPRESFYLATKLCAWMIAHDEKSAKQQFYTSLERTGAGYFDFYLLHSLKAGNVKKYDDYHIWEFVAEQQEKGLIRHWGFSFHDQPAVLDRILTAHPDAEFVQLQINYQDWENASIASRANYEVARAHGKPVVIMEPVKGGKLAKLPKEAEQILRTANPDASIPSWAIRFAASLPGVITVLSGMSNLEQMQDNLSYMKEFEPLTADERAALQQVRGILGAAKTIPCTACRYCMAECPKHIAIPEVFDAMNRYLENGDLDSAKDAYAKVIAEGSGKASDCVSCGQCTRACPQGIEAARRITECAETLE